jgi:hypothetical protein
MSRDQAPARYRVVRFFGYDVTNAIPDEIGGVVLMKGQDGTLSAWYVAD